MFLVETILLLQVEGFQPPFFVERKYIEYSFLIWNILLLIKGQYGLVSLAIYPISTLSVIDLSSESTCTCLCSIKAPDGIFCLFEKLYHVLLRLSVGVVCDVLYVFSTLCQVMVQLLLQIFVQASCHGRFESGPGLTRVRPGSGPGSGLCSCDSALRCEHDILQLSWQTATKQTEHKRGDRLRLSQPVAGEMTNFIWADRSQLSWQPTWRVATEPSDSSWAELTYRSWTAMLQLSWLTELTDCCQADMSWLSRHIAAETTDCNWTDTIQGRAAKEVTLCSSADWLQPSVLIADGLKTYSGAERCAPELTVWSWLGSCQPSWQTAAPLTSCSQSRQIAKLTVSTAAVGLQLSWQVKAGLTDCRGPECVQLDSLIADWLCAAKLTVCSHSCLQSKSKGQRQ